MKYNTLKATFKNGMVSPRLRGREKEGEITSSAEKIENFFIDKVGGAVKRGGIQIPQTQPFLNANDEIFRYDSFPIEDTVDTTFFAVNLRGREFIFRFNKSKAINAIVNEVNPTTVADFQSTFLQVINPDDGSYFDTRPFAPYFTATSGYANNGDLCAFNYSQGTPVVDTQLDNYLHELYPSPTHMAKVTDSTVVFTCGNENNFISNISFTVSLINLPILSGLAPTSEVMVILPYFVNVRAFVANLGKPQPSTSYYNPIQPLNFPFNSVNTNSSLTISCSLLAGQSGTPTPNGVLSVPDNQLVWLITVPQDICIDITYQGYKNSDALVGKFISIPDASNVRDVVFFITKYQSTIGNNYRFFAIQITGFTPESNSTRWKVSTFGGQTHPRCVAYCFGRLIYGNAGIDESIWWASGVHPSNLSNFQGFLGYSLLQDATSNVSGMLNEGIATPGTTDYYRYGFVGQVPTLAPVAYIQNRRRIHFGTHAGECQLTINNTGLTRDSYEINTVRSNHSIIGPASSGDGKYFYIGNYGKDIRFVSTEDRDYESVDGLVTTALEGLGLIFDKILWYEKLNALIARTSTNRIFFITLHEDTQIKAVSEFISELDIVDFCVSLNNLYFVFNLGGYRHVSRYLPTTSTSGDLQNEVELGGDMAVCFPSVTGELWYENLYPFFLGEIIYLFYNGEIYEIEIPLTYDGTHGSIQLPVDISEATVNNPAFFYGKKVTAKIKTMPISEGGGNDSAVGDITRIDRVLVQVDGSGPFRVGNENGTIYDAEGVQLSPLSTKYVKFDMPQSPDIENHLYIETDKPTPLNISGVAYRGVSNNGE